MLVAAARTDETASTTIGAPAVPPTVSANTQSLAGVAVAPRAASTNLPQDARDAASLKIVGERAAAPDNDIAADDRAADDIQATAPRATGGATAALLTKTAAAKSAVLRTTDGATAALWKSAAPGSRRSY